MRYMYISHVFSIPEHLEHSQLLTFDFYNAT